MPEHDLCSKYGADAFAAGRTLQPKSFERRLAQRDALDQHYTRLWIDFAIEGLGTRPALDARTRLLVLIGLNTTSLYRQALRNANLAYDRTLLASAKVIGE